MQHSIDDDRRGPSRRKLAIAGDGQVTLDKTVMKHGARKVRKICRRQGDGRLRRHRPPTASPCSKSSRASSREFKDLTRAAVELAKDWRQDRALRRLEALLIVGNPEHSSCFSGTGDVIEPDEGIAAIGSGGPYAQAAAAALLRNTALSMRKRSRAKALEIAARDLHLHQRRHHRGNAAVTGTLAPRSIRRH